MVRARGGALGDPVGKGPLTGLLLALRIVVPLVVLEPAPAPLPVWRLIDRPALHVGLRPAVHLDGQEVAAGATLQVTARVPW